MAEEKKENEVGLLPRQDDVIYPEKNSFDGSNWDILRTRIGSQMAIQMFTFGTYDQATKAGRKIAEAIGGQFYSIDPRE